MLRPNFNALIDGVVRTKTVEYLMDQAKISEADPKAATPDGAPEATSAS